MKNRLLLLCVSLANTVYVRLRVSSDVTADAPDTSARIVEASIIPATSGIVIIDSTGKYLDFSVGLVL